MTVIDEIAEEISEFEADHGRKPVRMWLTKRDKFDVAKLKRTEFSMAGTVMEKGVERTVKELFGVPIASWDAAQREYRLSDGESAGTAASVKARIEDWVKRLNALFESLDEWTAGVPEARVERNHMQQQIEGSMEQFSVKAQNVPTFTIFIGKNRIAFVPSALWISGANGRVNVTTNYRQYALVDLSQVGKPSDWKLVLASPRTQLAPFNEELFLKILAERA
jgi:hypothetical protein